MSARLISRYADDPRVVTVLVVALVSAALWLATWQTMSGMMAMPGMDKMDAGSMDMPTGEMDGSGGMNMEMPQGDAMTMGDGAAKTMPTADGAEQSMPMEGMPMEGMPMDGVKMDGMAMDMPGMSMDPTDWSFATIATTTAMWILMMAAMMLPSMAPVVAIYAGLSAKEDSGLRLALRITVFTFGYLTLWFGFSIVAALGQLTLRASEFFTMGGTLALPLAAGALLIFAGIYQFTQVKEFCLAHCRHPLAYLMQHWKEGLKGAYPVGFTHGIYCLGCCVALMGLMFVYGAMNVLWMAVIALYLIAEKIVPRAEIWGRIAGALMIVTGAVTIAREFI
ncbi:MAG: DUF2182 domain-containing protein [Pseudomonadota bacterium]